MFSPISDRPMSRFPAGWGVGVLCLCGVVLGGCYRSAEEAERLRQVLEQETETREQREAPSPAEAPPVLAETPGASPAPAPPAVRQEPAPPPEPREAPPVASDPPDTWAAPEMLARLRDGLQTREVEQILGRPGVQVSGDLETRAVYRWTDETGDALLARFEAGRLTRWTLLRPDVGEEAPPEDDPASAQEANAREEGEGEEVEQAAEEDVRTVLELPRRDYTEWPAPEPEVEVEPEPDPEPTLHPGIRVARDPRRAPVIAVPDATLEGDEEPAAPQSSYRPRAQLPRFSMSLRRGVYELRIANQGESTIRAGVRGDGRGRDLTVRPGGTRSVFLDQGTYQLHFIDEADPYTLLSGPSATIDGQFQADLLATFEDGESSIGPLAYDPGERIIRR